jgi:hypothetical protein
MFHHLNTQPETFGRRSDLSEGRRGNLLTNVESFIETLSLIAAIIYVKQTLWPDKNKLLLSLLCKMTSVMA